MHATFPGSPPKAATSLLHALRDVVGADHAAGEEAARAIADPYGFGEDAPPAGDIVVSPASVEQIQAVLRIAQAHDAAVWPVSRGRNLGYGAASPRRAGGIVMNLARMNRILVVDEACGAVIVEPGVTFLQLHAHLRATGSRLWTSVPDIGWGSVIGNALERGFGYAAHGDHAAAQCGMEVVLADGEVVRTGMGAKADSPAWPLYKGGFGPGLDSLFFQSSLGIVTKMGLWLQPAPERAASCKIALPRNEDLGALVETLRPLLLDTTIQSPVTIGNAVVVAAMMSDRATWCDTHAPIGEVAVARITELTGLGRWNARFGVYGPAAVVAAKIAVIERALARGVPDATMAVTDYAGDVDPVSVHPTDRAPLGIPSTDLIRMAAWRGGDPAHIDFSVVCRPDGESAARFVGLLQERVEHHGFDYAGGFTLFPRHAVALAFVGFDKGDPADAAAVRALFPDLVARASALGGASYRAHLAYMDLVSDQYDWGEFALRRLQERLKDALDPAGLLAPGKQGIWPARDRAPAAAPAPQRVG